MPNGPFDLKARPCAMVEAGFRPTSAGGNQELAAQKPAAKSGALPVKDMRALLLSSIDNDSSRDLDQVEFAEKLPDGTIRLLVGIAEWMHWFPKARPRTSMRPRRPPQYIRGRWYSRCCRTIVH